MKKYFEYTDAISNKFWEVNLKGKQVILTYGRIGIKKPAKIIKDFKGKTASEDAKEYVASKIKGKKIKVILKNKNKNKYYLIYLSKLLFFIR